MVTTDDMIFCVLDLDGNTLWSGTSALTCASMWAPSTYWGAGDTLYAAKLHALRYVLQQRQRNREGRAARE